ncbi:LCP family protein [Nocardioides caldifontis]|uniref:LCP family protein n=1 Tax=Nocardioides caldifontis TaxID=2588938 RepID=UPI0011DF80C9|nr:LCP family protein [Nocardioides caldifontis]
MSYRGKHRRAVRHPVLRAVAATTAMVLLAIAGTAFLAYRHLEGNITVSNGFDDILGDRPDEVDVEGPSKPLNVLILGSDTREGQREVSGSSAGLSDTTILLHLSADRERAYGVSIPRDLLVDRPECTDPDDGSPIEGEELAQWNDAFALGGEACTIAQFEEMAGLRVNHFVVVDFAGFKTMVDALGGVPVCVPQEVNDPIGDIYLPAGTYKVTGNQALDYVRVRHSIGTIDTGDIGRMKRQQAFLASMVNTAVSAGTLFNPAKLWKFLNAATQSLTADPELSKMGTLFDLAQDVRNIGLDKVQFFTVPFEPYELDPNRLVPAPEAERLWEQLRHDEPLRRNLTSGATKASEGDPSEPKKRRNPEQEAQAARDGLCA